MAGFLDKNTRVVDMILTGLGRRLLSQGDLNFCYWVPFDDEIDYDPFISQSGSLSEDALIDAVNASIEETPIREAVAGYKFTNSMCEDFTNVVRPMFTTAQGQVVLPRAIVSASSDEVTTLQRRFRRMFSGAEDVIGKIDPIDIGVERFGSTGFVVEFSYEKDSFNPDFQPEGFFVTVLASGSSGYTEVVPKRDMSNDLSYNNDVKVHTGGGE